MLTFSLRRSIAGRSAIGGISIIRWVWRVSIIRVIVTVRRIGIASIIRTISIGILGVRRGILSCCSVLRWIIFLVAGIRQFFHLVVDNRSVIGVRIYSIKKNRKYRVDHGVEQGRR